MLQAQVARVGPSHIDNSQEHAKMFNVSYNQFQLGKPSKTTAKLVNREGRPKIHQNKFKKTYRYEVSKF